MIKTKTKKIPASVETIDVAIICDGCGAVSKQDDGWATGNFDLDEITIMRKTGSSFPEGGFGQKFIVDLCPLCFESKFMVWLKAEKIEGRVEEWDW